MLPWEPSKSGAPLELVHLLWAKVPSWFCPFSSQHGDTTGQPDGN